MSRILLILSLVCLALCGCGHRTRPATTHPAALEPMPVEAAMQLIDNRAAWDEHPTINIPRHPAEKYLQGWTIVLDPGHGGEDGGELDARTGHKRGPTGVREAHMNLRVGLLLRRLLADAGVNVIMTREADDTVSLRQRAEVANRAGAHLFISLHHNAVGNPRTNYTSVWYHGPVDAAEPELDVAKYIAHALGRELRTEVGKTSPILDDKLMYNTGFGVLRMCRVPAILLESSFYTNPAEEQRLRDAGHNLREAYGVYVGLCEYAYGGRPTQSPPKLRLDGSRLTLETTLDPGLPQWWGADRNRIVSSTIHVEVNGRAAEQIQFDPTTRLLTALLPGSLEELSQESLGEVVVRVHHANLFKHHNYPQRFSVVGSEADGMALEPVGPPRARMAPSTAPSTRPTTNRARRSS